MKKKFNYTSVINYKLNDTPVVKPVLYQNFLSKINDF